METVYLMIVIKKTEKKSTKSHFLHCVKCNLKPSNKFEQFCYTFISIFIGKIIINVQ